MRIEKGDGSQEAELSLRIRVDFEDAKEQYPVDDYGVEKILKAGVLPGGVCNVPR